MSRLLAVKRLKNNGQVGHATKPRVQDAIHPAREIGGPHELPDSPNHSPVTAKLAERAGDPRENAR